VEALTTLSRFGECLSDFGFAIGKKCDRIFPDVEQDVSSLRHLQMPAIAHFKIRLDFLRLDEV
jgi:hypothetical protein